MRKRTAVARLTGPTPYHSMRSPATAGPMRRAAWNAVAFKATALAM